MAEPSYAVKARDASTWAAFAALVERNNGIFGGCWCMGFHPDDSRTDAAANRENKLARVKAGTAKLGFIRDRQIGKHRWVVTRVVEPRDDAGGSPS